MRNYHAFLNKSRRNRKNTAFRHHMPTPSTTKPSKNSRSRTPRSKTYRKKTNKSKISANINRISTKPYAVTETSTPKISSNPKIKSTSSRKNIREWPMQSISWGNRSKIKIKSSSNSTKIISECKAKTWRSRQTRTEPKPRSNQTKKS